MTPEDPRRTPSDYVIGVDLGTSGCRAIAIDARGEVVGEARVPLPAPQRSGAGVEQASGLWWEAIDAVIPALIGDLPAGAVQALAVDGTSGTVLLTDADGTPLVPALMYNDNRAVGEARRIAAVAPATSAAHGTGSGLAKLLWLLAHADVEPAAVATQADWISGRLTGRPGVSDANSVLKLGWDALGRRWPAWLAELGVPARLLPQVVEPGTRLGRLRPELARRWGLPESPWVAAGTTDSTAAILATGATAVGDAITSLGSTLVTKIVAEAPIFDPEYGVYSQPFGDRWLVGGGSNSGGAVLRQFFGDERLVELTARLDPDRPTGLDYYPLPAPGERFPVNDPALAPRLTPRPGDDATFLQGLLEGMAAIEAAAYRKLHALGAPYPSRVFTVGGGARNPAWGAIRQRAIGRPLAVPVHEEAAYGSALLARRCLTGGN